MSNRILKRIINNVPITFTLQVTDAVATGDIKTQIEVLNHKVTYWVRYSTPLTYSNVVLWIEENEEYLFDYYTRYFDARDLTRYVYEEGEMHPYLGKDYPLKINLHDKSGICSIDLKDNAFVVELSSGFPNKKEAIALLLKKWYNNTAYNYFKERSEFYRKKMPFVPDHGDLIIKIVESGKFHGRCTSGKRLIEYNYPTIKLSPDIIDYLVVHELCHFKEHNHKPPFWRLVRQYCPRYKQLDMDIDVKAIIYCRGI